MERKTKEISPMQMSASKRLALLILLFVMIVTSIFTIRHFFTRNGTFSVEVADQIAQELADNRIVLSNKNGHRTVVDFKEPILLAHGRESRLIVHTAHL